MEANAQAYQDGFQALEALLQEAKAGTYRGTRAEPVIRCTPLGKSEAKAVVRQSLRQPLRAVEKAKRPRKPQTKRYRGSKAAALELDAKRSHQEFCNALRNGSATAAVIRALQDGEAPIDGPAAFIFYKGYAELQQADTEALVNYKAQYTSSPTDGMYDRETICVKTCVKTAANAYSSCDSQEVQFEIDASPRGATYKYFVSKCGGYVMLRSPSPRSMIMM